ncbi:MAG: phage tail sheath subtilisin-like domain-containing protein [Firmicutes bacterium]|nr:phage tail sheath subtilisin-like domain-containing protein [Bacillota bacterium]
MAYQSPGVYVEEVSGGVKPIAGVGTSTGAFVGIAEKGDPDKAKLITNWGQFVKEFGGFIPNAYLAYAVYSFFAEGGTSCYVVRVAPSGALASSYKSIKEKKDTNPRDILDITARSAGKWGDRITVVIEDASNNKRADGSVIDEKLFKLTVNYQEDVKFESEYETEGVIEIYDRLSLLDIAKRLEASAFIKIELKNITIPDETDKAAIDAFNTRPANGSYPLSGGADGGDAGFADADFIGTFDNKKGMHAFDEVDDINIMAIPDKAGDREVIQEALNYCKLRKDCFFIADPPYGITPTDVAHFKNASSDTYTGNVFNSPYGALYYPWVYINDPMTSRKKLVPPSGVVAGTYAYTDTARGVHKAPAGVEAGYLDSVSGVERIVTSTQQESLNPLGINVIRSLPAGICIWGARTLVVGPSEWTYINVRRLFMFLEESIDEGTQWVVFEPNDPSLWGKVKRNLTAFLTRVWRDGALYGATPEEAFFVKVDAENNPPEVRDAGQLVIEVGVAPVRPAEFVIIRVSQKTLVK